MKRLTVLLAIAGSFLSLGMPAHAAGNATYAGTMTYAQPVTPVPSPNQWTFNGNGAGTLAPDVPTNFSYTGPLSLVVRGISQNESLLGGDTDVQILDLRGQSETGSVRMAKLPAGVRIPRRAGSPITVQVWVNLNYCNQFGCINIDQCVSLTITYSTWPFPSASASTGTC